MDALVGEIRNGYKGEQDAQILLKMLGGIEIVAGDGVGGKGIRLGAVFGQLLQGVAVLGIKHLVLQIMGDAGGGIQPLAVQPEAQIHAAVAGGKKGVFARVTGLADDADRQAVGERFPNGGFSDAVIGMLCHCAASFPRRKYTVSSCILSAASQMRSGVTACRLCISSSGVSR